MNIDPSRSREIPRFSSTLNEFLKFFPKNIPFDIDQYRSVSTISEYGLNLDLSRYYCQKCVNLVQQPSNPVHLAYNRFLMYNIVNNRLTPFHFVKAKNLDKYRQKQQTIENYRKISINHDKNSTFKLFIHCCSHESFIISL